MISTSVCNSIPRSALRLRLQNRDQFQNVARRRVAVVDDKIAVFLRHHRAADARAFQAEFVNQFARRNGRRILERAAGARRGGLRRPAFLAERAHPLRDGFRRIRPALEHRAQRDVIFQRARSRDMPPTFPPARVRARCRQNPSGGPTRRRQTSRRPSRPRSCATRRRRCRGCLREIPSRSSRAAAPRPRRFSISRPRRSAIRSPCNFNSG